MSTYTDASLIVTPNSYKEGKLYSIIPTDGSGDLGVVRATTATRVNEQGLIEEVPYNLLTYSEDFSNASWDKTNSLVISNQIISPDGNTTADKINETAISGYHLVKSNISISGTYTSSVFAKKGERNFVMLWNDGTNSGRFFDLENGILGGTLGAVPLDSKIEDYGNGWYRCIITNNNATRLSIYTAISSTSAFYLGEVGKGIYIWGAQLEKGSTAKPYFKTTDRLNIPRIDYTNASCPSILVEPQRTNLVSSSQPTDTGGFKTGVVFQSTSIFGWNGIYYGDNSVRRVAFIPTTTSVGVQYCFSFFVKMTDGTIPSVGSTSSNDFQIYIGSVTSENLKITEIGSGIYKVSITRTVTSTTSNIAVEKTTSMSSKTFEISGLQLEAGSNATSYIPTVASTVTRNADVISKTGISGITTITETFEDDTTNVISGSPTSYTMSQGRIKHVIGL